MWLSTVDFKTWVMAVKIDEYGAAYKPPVEGIIIPSPGTIFRDKILTERFCLIFHNHYLPALGFNLFVDEDKLHILSAGKAICNSGVFSEIKSIVGNAFLCMHCQYKLWRARNVSKTPPR